MAARNIKETAVSYFFIMKMFILTTFVHPCKIIIKIAQLLNMHIKFNNYVPEL